MPKTHHSEAPPNIQKKFAIAHEDMEVPSLNGERFNAVAAGQLAWLRCVFREGYRADLADLHLPVHAQVAELTQAGAIAEAANFKKRMSIEFDFEQRCARLVESMTAWAQKPSRFEEQAAEHARRTAAAREEAIQKRTAAILSEQKANRSAAAAARARKQAEKEVQP